MRGMFEKLQTKRQALDIRDVALQVADEFWHKFTHRRARNELRVDSVVRAAQRSRSALLITDTDDRLMASAASMGLSSQPVKG